MVVVNECRYSFNGQGICSVPSMFIGGTSQILKSWAWAGVGHKGRFIMELCHVESIWLELALQNDFTWNLDLFLVWIKDGGLFVVEHGCQPSIIKLLY